MRFALRMKTKDGEEVAVRDLVALKEYFDPESVLEIFQDGKLAVWLRSHHCDAEAEAVEALANDDAEVLLKLCRIFGRDDLADDFERKYAEERRQEEEQKRREEQAAQWLEDAQKAEEAEVWNTAFKLFQMAADAGNLQAIVKLGLCYYNGEGTEQDYTKAYKLWMEAAAQNDGIACFGLGTMYHYGNGVAKDLVKAESWYGKSIEFLGYPVDVRDAMERIGDIHLEQGDWNAAMSWYEKAVQCMWQNEIPLQDQEVVVWLAADYLSGRSPKNEKIGWELLNAYSDGNPDRYGAKLRDVADQLMGNFDETGNWDMTIPLYQIAAKAGDGDAYWALGVAHQNGYGNLRQDAKEIFDLYNKGAGADSPLAMNQLAHCYMDGYGVAENVNLAIKWQHKAIDQLRKNHEDVPAYMFANLGAYYMTRGAGIGVDWSKAEKYLRKAAELGDEDAVRAMAEHFGEVIMPAGSGDSGADSVTKGGDVTCVPATDAQMMEAFRHGMGTRDKFVDFVLGEVDGGPVLAGAAKGAAAGAAVASIIPGFGTIFGGAIGAVAGALTSGLSTDEMDDVRNYVGNWYDALNRAFVDCSKEQGFDAITCEAAADHLDSRMKLDVDFKEEIKSRKGIENAESFVSDTLKDILQDREV